jgi:hypothetical protein
MQPSQWDMAIRVALFFEVRSEPVDAPIAKMIKKKTPMDRASRK